MKLRGEDRIKRKLYIVLGFLSFLIGAIGVVLPVLPTTPLLLLSAWFFARSSKRFRHWLENTRLYQIYVGEYERTGGIRWRKKWQILIFTYLVMGISIYFVPLWPVRLFIIICGLCFGYFLFFRIKTIHD
ncbi:hypothetical protein HMPREF2829_02200 [Aerococcus sp. HMSC072A12]|uniref:DUF454 domain-containing protein n=1 Tax=Aerococcus sanguinicola TaxID=119206 RepID=A0A5N1GQU5_9LACT|nr:DUF454 domain-containing protein [Aerococcus sanguinicola]OFK13465.1 hypothetical protein HMPREF2829_02200 [Aerococcus sp. HMSC072A12]OFR35603.1 hypothetical protein HMPREF2892_00880 [Aerococcus sp. HMSC061A03]OFT43550.1 hypothetical protein HMPREF3161_00875 [Aerococcus sp. HMSC06H08]